MVEGSEMVLRHATSSSRLEVKGPPILMTIGQVAKRAGLRPSAIRYYEAQGLLPAATRRNGRRVYDRSIVERLAVIALAKMAGFRLDDIRLVVSRGRKKPSRAWRMASRGKHEQLERQMARLAFMQDVLARIGGCECATLEECGRAFLAARSRQAAPAPPAAAVKTMRPDRAPVSGGAEGREARGLSGAPEGRAVRRTSHDA
jgi:MerR family redox-sensitive transcriptional activator SoxR